MAFSVEKNVTSDRQSSNPMLFARSSDARIMLRNILYYVLDHFILFCNYVHVNMLFVVR